ncbi:MAG: leucyl aminopeptidase [Methylocystaceae bacterium]
MVPEIFVTPDGKPAEALALLFKEGEPVFDGWVEPKLTAELAEHARLARFTGKKDSMFKLPLADGERRMIYLVGLGTDNKITAEVYRQAAAKLVRQVKRDYLTTLAIAGVDMEDKETSQAITEGLILGSYVFDCYRRPDKDENIAVNQVMLVNGNTSGVRQGAAIARAQVEARNLANEPGNVVTPAVLAEWAANNLTGNNLTCQVYDENELQSMQMETLWQVGKGSINKPRFIHAVYRPAEPTSKVVLVGKGITFDSGGLDIKPGESMRGMKGDKSGACAVLAAMKALAELQPNVEVHGLVAAAENMPGGGAYRPDDIIKTRSGKTVEVVSTDAEGRLTLADALDYAGELKPDIIVDLATLTGACVVALGDNTAGLFSNDEGFKIQIEAAAKNSGERVWALPLDDERLRKRIKSGAADLLNSGGRYGGAITAAMFLQEFVAAGIKWAHIDMAGTDNYKEEFSYYSKGASGWGARLLLNLIMAM